MNAGVALLNLSLLVLCQEKERPSPMRRRWFRDATERHENPQAHASTGPGASDPWGHP
jgi:hypothetical protein